MVLGLQGLTNAFHIWRYYPQYYKGTSLTETHATTSGNITDDVILQYLQEHEPIGGRKSEGTEELKFGRDDALYLRNVAGSEIDE